MSNEINATVFAAAAVALILGAPAFFRAYRSDSIDGDRVRSVTPLVLLALAAIWFFY